MTMQRKSGKPKQSPKATKKGERRERLQPAKNRHERVTRKAGEGIRTLDIQLGKLTLCQLSYARTALRHLEYSRSPRHRQLADCQLRQSNAR
jgi:hypothetical protein